MNSNKISDISAWLLLDKPSGISSSAALTPLRRLFTKVGHAGTLDPFASGLLIVGLNKATSLIDYVVNQEKEYEFTVIWGEGRDTDDIDGAVTTRMDKYPTLQEIYDVIPSFIGQQKQVPPPYSALKVYGERSYKLARQGLEFSLLPRDIEVKKLEVSHVKGADIISETSFIASVSKGSYIRALARDIAAKLGTVGYVSALRRTTIGGARVQDAISWADIANYEKNSVQPIQQSVIKGELRLLPIPHLLRDIAVVEVSQDQFIKLLQGQSLAYVKECADSMVEMLVLSKEGGIALCEFKDNKLLPKRVLAAANY